MGKLRVNAVNSSAKVYANWRAERGVGPQDRVVLFNLKSEVGRGDAAEPVCVAASGEEPGDDSGCGWRGDADDLIIGGCRGSAAGNPLP